MDSRSGDFLAICYDRYYNDPILFSQEVIGISLSEQQSLAITTLATSPKKQVAIKSGHGVGKSCMLSICILWFMCTRPNARVIVTAPSSRQLYDTMMSEIRLWYNRSILKDFDLFTFTKDRVKLNDEEYGNNWFVSAVSVANPENISGTHAENVLAVVDESAGVEREIFVRLEGVLSTENSYIICTGNPSFTSGYFYDIFHNPDYSKKYELFTFSCVDSPNVDTKWVEYMKDKYGEDSPIYKVRVEGNFAPMNESTIIDRELVRSAMGREIPEQEQDTIFLGVDVSSGDGNDSSVICVRRGNKELKRYKYKIKLRDLKNRIIELVDINLRKAEYVVVNVDTTGLGIQLGQDLSDFFYYNEYVTINQLNFSFAGADRKQFSNAFTEMFFRLREIIESVSLLKIDDSTLEEDLGSRRYDFDNHNRYIAERKKEFIKRFNRSPDEGDAVLLAFYDIEDKSVLVENYIDREDW